MSEGIKRMIERHIAARLTGQVQGINFVAMTGGGDQEDATDIEPPFAVVTINNAEKRLAQFGVWHIQGSVQIVTHMSEATPTVHSELARVVYEALANLEPQEGETMVFHGIDVTGHRTTEEETEKIRVDALDFTAGVTG